MDGNFLRKVDFYVPYLRKEVIWGKQRGVYANRKQYFHQRVSGPLKFIDQIRQLQSP